MRILYLNPNSTEAMTESVVESARAALTPMPGSGPGSRIEVLGWTNTGAPSAIQGPEDGAAAVPGLLAQLGAARKAGADAIVIACFDDTGLDQIRAAAHCPVLGIGQSAYTMARLLGRRFSVVTTLAVSVPVIRDNIRHQGFAPDCTGVRPTGLPVLEVEAGGETVIARIADEIALAADQDGAGVAVLGCAGMAGLRGELAARAPIPVIDGVRASARLALALAG